MLTTRSTEVLATTRGYGFETELALPGLQSTTNVSCNVIPAEFQTHEYTQAIYGLFIARRLSAGLRGVGTEPDNRPRRSHAILESEAVETTVILPAHALRQEIGSAAVTASAVMNLRNYVVDIVAGRRPNLTVAIYDPTLSADYANNRYDPLYAGYGEFRITKSRENGQRVWVADALALAPEDSFPHHTLPIVARMLAEEARQGQEALDVIDDSLDFLRGRDN